MSGEVTLVTSELCLLSFLLPPGWAQQPPWTQMPKLNNSIGWERQNNDLKGSWSVASPGLLTFGMCAWDSNKSLSYLSLCVIWVFVRAVKTFILTNIQYFTYYLHLLLPKPCKGEKGRLTKLGQEFDLAQESRVFAPCIPALSLNIWLLPTEERRLKMNKTWVEKVKLRHLLWDMNPQISKCLTYKTKLLKVGFDPLSVSPKS